MYVTKIANIIIKFFEVSRVKINIPELKKKKIILY